MSAGTVIHYGADKRDLLHAALFADLEATLGQALAELGRGGLEARLGRLTRGVFGYSGSSWDRVSAEWMATLFGGG